MRDMAIIWDLDGVLVDTASQHFRAWRELCRRYGRDLSEDEFRDTFGQRNREILTRLFGSLDEDAIRARGAEKEELFRAAVSEVRALPGVLPLIDVCRRYHYRQAIGSSSPKANIVLLLEKLGLIGSFDSIVAEEDVRVGKPDPEIFLLASSKLGVPPERCVVIEDAVAGVAAARAAGTACIAVTTTRERAALVGADLVVDSLAEVSVMTIDGLVARRDVR